MSKAVKIIMLWGSAGLLATGGVLCLAPGAETAAQDMARGSQAQYSAQRDPGARYPPASEPSAIGQIPDLILHDSARSKDLHVRVYFPQAPGPFPVIVFSHGAGGGQDVGPQLLGYWASHGYVVIAPTHADSIALRRKTGHKTSMAGIIREFGTDAELRLSRVEDDAFIIDSLPDLGRLAPQLQGRLDPSRVGVGGHSAGAMTAMLMAGTKQDMAVNGAGGPETADLRDARVDCILVLSGQGITGQWSCFDKHSWESLSLPMMVMTGSLDDSTRTGQTAASRCDPYTYAPAGGKYLLFIDGAVHMSFTGRAAGQEGPGNGRLLGELLGAEGLDTAQDYDQQAIFEYVQQASLAFWDAQLKADAAARLWLASDALARLSGGQVQSRKK